MPRRTDSNRGFGFSGTNCAAQQNPPVARFCAMPGILGVRTHVPAKTIVLEAELNPSERDQLYIQARAEHGESMRRLVRGYEADEDRQRDLLQEMHIELWRSLQGFDHRCSLRTWVYRVANNVGADHLSRRRKASERHVELEALAEDPTVKLGENQEQRRQDASALQTLIHRLAPLDRQIILLYLEGETAAEIAAVTGLTPGNTATKIHRIKKLLNREYTGAAHESR
jgi:RNA polymerase sigma-70 factor (ECF subfamily)